MNFASRTALGETLATKLGQLRGRDAVVVCLQESSLTTCLTLAARLRAFVYPLVFAPVYNPDHTHELLGGFGPDGEFYPLPEKPEVIKTGPTPDVSAIAQAQKATAMKTVQRQLDSYGLEYDRHQLDGRDVILAADVVTSPLPLVMAGRMLQGLSPKSLTAAVGNATLPVAELIRLSAGQSYILDVLSGIIYDHGHYFEHPDAYTPEQKSTLTQHIAAYWQ